MQRLHFLKVWLMQTQLMQSIVTPKVQGLRLASSFLSSVVKLLLIYILLGFLYCDYFYAGSGMRALEIKLTSRSPPSPPNKGQGAQKPDVAISFHTEHGMKDCPLLMGFGVRCWAAILRR